VSDAAPDSLPVPPATRGRTAVPLRASGWRFLPLSLAVVAADQAAKAWILHNLQPLERVHIFKVLDIVLTYNTGAAFSFLAEASGWQRWVFVLLALVVSSALIVWLRRIDARGQGVLACGLALIIGGALGNMLDRIAIGRVVDFIYVHWGTAYFPAFNLADSAITIGAALLLFDAWRESRAARRVRA
jgi:signal peptidase II